ncbi:MAG: interleukin-like EMT inducer domain-containing protein [Anaerolineae bacterium]
MTHKGRKDLLALAIFTLLTLVLSYPLPLRFSTHVPGSATWAFDEYTFVYNLWWFKYATLDLGSNPLYCQHIFYPLGASFVLYTYVLYHALISLPLQPFLTLPAVSNLLLLLTTVLSAYGTYLLAGYLLRRNTNGQGLTPEARWLAALGAGIFYAFAAPRAIYAALGHYDMVSTQWIPFYALYLVKTVHERRWKNPAMAGLFATLAMLCEMIFGVFLGLLTLVYLAVAWRQRDFHGVHRLPGAPQKLPAWLGLGAKLGVLGLTAILTYLPVLAHIVPEMRQGYVLAGWGHADQLSADLLGFVTPTALNPIWGQDWAQHLREVKRGVSRFADVNTVVIGWGLLALAALGWRWKGQRAAAWVWGAFLAALFSLGPLLQINGQSVFDLDGLQVSFPLPFIILHYIPFVRGNRAPNRFSVLLLLCVAVLAGYGLAWLLRQTHRVMSRVPVRPALWLAPMATLVVAGAMLEHLAIPLPLTDARIPEFYQRLGQEPGDFSLLTLPLGWRDSFGVLGDESTQVQYYQTAHHKRLIAGNITRHPPFTFEYYQRIPFFKAVTDLELYQEPDTETVQKAHQQAADLLYLYDVRYLVVNPAVPGRLPYADTRERTFEFVRQVLPLAPEPVYDRDGLVAYRTLQPPPQHGFEVDLGQEASWMYQGPGWSFDEVIGGASAVWATGQEATLFFPLRDVAPHRLVFRAWPFAFEGAAPQWLSVRVNGQELTRGIFLDPGWQEYILDVPARYLRYGLNEVTFRFAHVDAPRDVLPPQRAIGTTGVQTPVDIEVHSAGAEGGRFAYVTVGHGRDEADASAHRRGYNVAVLDPHTGQLLEKRGFDTWANPYEAEALARFLAEISEGQIVIAAVQEDGARHLTEEAVQALWSIGAAEDPRGREGQAHAIIGVKGAARGTALEQAGGPSAYLRLGRNPDDRTLAAAFDWVRLESWVP